MDTYIPLIAPDGRTIFMPQNLLAYGVYANPVIVQVSNPVAPVSLPEFVETMEAPVVHEQISEPLEVVMDVMQQETVETSADFPEELNEVEASEVMECTMQIPEETKNVETISDVMLESAVDKFVEDLIEGLTDDFQAPETMELTMQVPAMKKVKTIEQDDIIDAADDMSVSSEVSNASNSVDVHDQTSFPDMAKHDDDESGEVPQRFMIKKNLPVYRTKVAMRVRSDCTRDAPEVHRLAADTRVFVLENGIESFPTKRLVDWWKQTFTNMDYVAENIRREGIDGRALADFDGSTVQRLGLYADQSKNVKKQLALVSRKSQIIYFVDGEAQRGWVSKIKGGKAQMSRIFLNSKPSIVIRRMSNEGLSITRCEERLAHTFEALNLAYDAIRLGSFFEEFRFGSQFIINKKGLKRHGEWKPANHCLIEFSNHQDAASALKKLASFAAYPDSFDVCEGFALYSRGVTIAFERDYANLQEITYPRF